ncbi:MAG: hypothetical protein O6944_06515 [Gammaproteobacteria bacterium]|nr:hypothetical protein [Gammaproteobacteria bacterium]
MNCKPALLLIFSSFAAYAGGGETILGHIGTQSVQISPNGEHIAVLTRRSTEDQLYVVGITSLELVLQRGSVAPRRFYSADWLDKGQLVLQIGEDIRNEIAPQQIGVMELLALGGDVSQFPGSASTTFEIPSELIDQRLLLVDSLPQLAGQMLIESRPNKALWLADVSSGVAELIEYPPLRSATIIASPKLAYLIASAVDDTGIRQMAALDRSSDGAWRMLETGFEPVAINDVGIVYAYFRDGVQPKALATVDVKSGSSEVVYQDNVDDVTEVMLDSSHDPIAIRVMPDYPSWRYVGTKESLTSLHKDLRAAVPGGDVLIVSMSSGESKMVIELIYDSKPSDYVFVDATTKNTKRILQSETGIFSVGGNSETVYSIQPFSVQADDGSEASGLVSAPKDGGKPQSTIVLLGASAGQTRWKWGYRDEVSLLNRHGLNVLMIDLDSSVGAGVGSSKSDINAAIANINTAIAWGVENDLVNSRRICILGRGYGAELALRTAVSNRSIDCAIAVDGRFEMAIPLVDSVPADGKTNRRFDALFVYDAGQDDRHLINEEAIHRELRSFGIEIETMVIEGEKNLISNQLHQVRALAQISTFLKNNILGRHASTALPLTYEQGVVWSDIVTGFQERLDYSDAKGMRNLLAWIEQQDAVMRASLSDEQWPLYMSVKENLIDSVTLDSDDFFRSNESIRQTEPDVRERQRN